ncbi:MAG: HAMP domain-containing histidine kinase [Deltaproteobacteria bacterium]|nr:HAMP domain-containing histidine kinase [Deltaproteobacteria bacterium]
MRSLIDLSIQHRVYVGTAVGLLALGVMGGTAVLGLDASRSGTQALEEAHGRVEAILELDRATVELQRSVQVYTQTGHRGVAERVTGNIQRLGERIVAFRDLVEGDEAAELVAHMSTRFETYRATFAEVVEEREIRRRLVREETHHTHQALSDAVLRYQERFGAATTLRLDLLRFENALLTYLDDPQQGLLDDASTIVQRAADRVQARHPGSPEAEDVARLLTEYERQFTRISQATRAYLYLTGVVMAGEAMELMYTSERLRETIVADTRPISERVEATARRTAYIMWVVLLLVAALGIGAGWYSARTITQPLGIITETLRRISAGDRQAEIPTFERRDEIGVLADAAHHFQAKVGQTQALLEQSMELTWALNHSRQELERSNGELEQFVHTVSHDLKSPIVTILGFIGMTKDLIARGQHDQAARKLHTVERAAKRMSQLVQDLLQLSRVGRVDMDLKSLNMDSLVDDLLGDMAARLADARFVVRVEGPLPPLQGNESRVIQLFDNLMGNAIKYGATAPTPQIVIGGHEDEHGLHYFVRDNGPGIPPQHHARIFGLFERLDASTEGTGIGLAIVKRIMTFHRGEVRVDSKGEGDGATFWLTFPRPESGAGHEECAGCQDASCRSCSSKTTTSTPSWSPTRSSRPSRPATSSAVRTGKPPSSTSEIA